MSPGRPAALMFLLAGMGGALLPGGTVAAQAGCTPCECNAAYCEGGYAYWGYAHLAPLPENVEVGVAFQVDWTLTLESNDPAAPSPHGNWSVGQTGLGISADPIPDDARPGVGHTFAAAQNATYPDAYEANVTLHTPGPFHIRAWAERGWSEERVVDSGGNDEGEDTDSAGVGQTTTASTPSNGSPGLPAALVVAALAVGVAARRRN